MSSYLLKKQDTHRMRLPLNGVLDLTYRCNNRCRHCWVLGSEADRPGQAELAFGEITSLVDEARSFGCREWAISGGEPMIRPDFCEIFDYVTSRASRYSLNTNGTFITPHIAKLLTRKGRKLICLYGATRDVHDHITRNPGSFDAALQGIEYMREAGAGFAVQLMVMRDNYHQLDDMVRLAQSLSHVCRFGGDWLYLSSTGNPQRNAEICSQRLEPSVVVRDIMKPCPWCQDGEAPAVGEYTAVHRDHLLDACILKEEFHVDPYGSMSFCAFIKDPRLRLSLRDLGFADIWENRLPELIDTVQQICEADESVECLTCESRKYCFWCPAHSFLEHGSYTTKMDYLCGIASENRRFQEDYLVNNCRYFSIAGVTIKIQSALPLTGSTYHTKFAPFAVESPGDDVVTLTYITTMPELDERSLGPVVHSGSPWVIYANEQYVTYVCVGSGQAISEAQMVLVFNREHSEGRIYFPREWFERGKSSSLTFSPTDQIFLAPLMSCRQAVYVHSSGAILDGNGLLFVGHSDAGKSTTIKMLKDHAEILCDDRNIVRRWPGEGFRVHGTWSHGEVPQVSASSAPLRAICFLQQSTENRLELMESKKEIIHQLIPCLIKGLELPDWWSRALDIVESIADEVPCYKMHFDKSGDIVDVMKATLSL